MKDKSVEMQNMDMEYSIMQMEAIMKVNGSMIRCKVGVDYFIKNREQHMMDNGRMMNLMDLVKYSMINLISN